jgi:hypothetical protein
MESVNVEAVLTEVKRMVGSRRKEGGGRAFCTSWAGKDCLRFHVSVTQYCVKSALSPRHYFIYRRGAFYIGYVVSNCKMISNDEDRSRSGHGLS